MSIQCGGIISAMFRQVLCRDCGFLASCDSGWFTRPVIYHELTVVDREKMAMRTHYKPGNELLCARGVWRDHYGRLENVNQQRSCKYFLTYKPGYTPAEHKTFLNNHGNATKKIVTFIVTGIMVVAAIVTIIAFVLGYL